jgi:hypothetical protein
MIANGRSLNTQALHYKKQEKSEKACRKQTEV